jgi:hypothetical protein
MQTEPGQLLSEVMLLVFRVNDQLLKTGDRKVEHLGLTSARWQILGAIAVADGTLNVVTVCAPVLMVVIIVSATVHFAHYYSAPRRSPATCPSWLPGEPATCCPATQPSASRRTRTTSTSIWRRGSMPGSCCGSHPETGH